MFIARCTTGVTGLDARDTCDVFKRCVAAAAAAAAAAPAVAAAALLRMDA